MKAIQLFTMGTALLLATLQAQNPIAFDAYQSGSTGADGIFDPVITVTEIDGILTTNITGLATGMVLRNGAGGGPKWTAIKYVDVQLNPTGVYNFTSIRIRNNYRVRFLPNAANTPVTFLSSGDIHLDSGGRIDVSADATQAALDAAGRDQSHRTPGPGGYPGGAPGIKGGGPLGGEGIVRVVSSFAVLVEANDAGQESASWPLTGGSGGGGARKTTTDDGDTYYAEGGGGGGVLYLAASGAIRLGYSSLFSANSSDSNFDLAGRSGYITGNAFAGDGGKGAAALIASTIERIGGGVLGTVDPEFFLASLAGTAQHHLPPVPVGVFPQGFPMVWFSQVGDVMMPEPQATGAQRVIHLPNGGIQSIGITARHLPVGLVFNVTFRGSNATNVVPFPATTGTFESSSTSSSFDFGTDPTTTVISAVTSAPINVAHAPVWRGQPLSEMRMALFPDKQPTLEFVTADGAVMSYETGMALAQQQGRIAFLQNPLL